MRLFSQIIFCRLKKCPASLVQRTFEIPTFLQMRKIECKYSDSLRIKKHCDTFFLQKVKKNAFSAIPIYIIDTTNHVSIQPQQHDSRQSLPPIKAPTLSLSRLTDNDGVLIIGSTISMEQTPYLRQYLPHTNYASATMHYFGVINRGTRQTKPYSRNRPHANIRGYYDRANAQVQPLSSSYARAGYPTPPVLSENENH